MTEVIFFTWSSMWICCRVKNAAKKSALPLLLTCKWRGLTMGRDPITKHWVKLSKGNMGYSGLPS